MNDLRKVAHAITSVGQAVRRQSSLGRILRDMRWTEQLAAARVQRVNEQKADRLRFLRDRLRRLLLPLAAFIRQERLSLADPKRPNIVRLDGGTIERTAAHRIRVTDEEAALEALKKLSRKHPDAIRTRLEINKLYLHAHPDLVDRVPGIEWDDTLADVFSFPNIDGRIECTDDDVITITFPRKEH